MRLGCIVEGHGEERAVPVLLRRFAAERLDPPVVLDAPVMLRKSRQQLVKEGELERWIEIVADRLGGRGGILVLIDADDDLPCVLGPALLRRAKAVRPDLPISVVIANREFEAWFLASLESLAGCRGLPAGALPVSEPERKRDPKGQLGELLPRGYSAAADQAAFTARLDLDAARKAPSFDKCYREIMKLLGG